MFKKVLSLVLILMLISSIGLAAIDMRVDYYMQSPNSIKLGQAISLQILPRGGFYPYSYAYYVYKDNNIVYKSPYSLNSYVKYIPNSTGDYRIKMYIKDRANNIKSGYTDNIRVLYYNVALNLNINAYPATTILGESISITLSPLGGKPNYSYAYYIYKDNKILQKIWYSSNSKLEYKPKAVGNYSVRAFVKDSTGKIVSKYTNFTVKRNDYRALVIGQRNYINLTQLDGTVKDSAKIYEFFRYRTPQATSYSLKLNNLTGQSILRAIRQAFPYTDENSVSIFYYTGHGDNDGGLIGVDDYSFSSIISPSVLANELNKLRGKIVVILDSCFSGNLINKSTSFAQNNIIRAFANVNSYKRSGEILTSKFHVITSSSMDEYSYENSVYGGFLTYGLLKARDINLDGFISMHEFYLSAKSFIKYTHNNIQNVQCYPLNDQLPIAK